VTGRAGDERQVRKMKNLTEGFVSSGPKRYI
jgi:hypothetical protein